MQSEQLTLSAWIVETGYEKIAKKLNINGSTVRHWKRGHCLPRAWQMREIRKLSKGKVSYEAMIDSFFENPKNKNLYK